MKRVLFISEQTGQLTLHLRKLLSLRPQDDVKLEQVEKCVDAVPRANEGWDLIVWMNYVGGVEQAVAEVRKLYSGPMLAASSIATYREAMVRAGCSHNLGSDNKMDVAAKILEILDLE